MRLRDHLGMDIAYIAELDGDDMIIRAHCAPDLPIDLPDQFTLPRVAGFCHYLVAGDIPSIITDSADHPVLVDLPVRHEFNIQSYIGLPLQREDGSNYGTLCCLGHQPNGSLNDRDLRTIKLFAELVVEQIDGELEDRRVSEERLNRINATIKNQALAVHYQPIVSLHDGTLKGFEALSRFEGTPYRSPDRWFTEAAQTGLGVELELTALECALKALDALPASSTLALNVSPECLMSEGIHDLLWDKTAERVELEITEHAPVEDYANLAQHIQAMKDKGIRIAVDDAGAGYSSLSHIVQLQPDIIKLDMSLTRDVDQDGIRRSLANALVYFAKETGVEIIAEGIETVGERDTLTALGVQYGQGYHFSKALSLDDAAAFSTAGSVVKSVA